MQGILSFLGFSLGASLGAGLVNALSHGVRPALRETIKAGIVASEGVRSAATEVRSTVSDLRDEAVAERANETRRRRGNQEPRKINIARD